MRIEDSKLRFLLPGLRIKRFIFVIILGILLIIYSVFCYLLQFLEVSIFLKMHFILANILILFSRVRLLKLSPFCLFFYLLF